MYINIYIQRERNSVCVRVLVIMCTIPCIFVRLPARVFTYSTYVWAIGRNVMNVFINHYSAFIAGPWQVARKCFQSAGEASALKSDSGVGRRVTLRARCPPSCEPARRLRGVADAESGRSPQSGSHVTSSSLVLRGSDLH